MAGILDGFEVGKRALLAQQAVQMTVGHNLANATTPGYSRQRALLVPAQIQNGVDVARITRIRDRYLDFAYLSGNQTLTQYQAQQGLLQRLQAVVSTPAGTGLDTVISALFQGFSDLSANPADQTVRVTVRDKAAQLVAAMQSMSGGIDQLKADLGTQVQQKVDAANSLIAQIADLHRQIHLVSTGSPPNDLLDQRDQLVDQLNGIIGVSATDRPDGTVQLAVAGTGVLLVDGTITAPLSVVANPGADTLDLRAGQIAVAPARGEMAALLDARNSATGSVKQAESDLDSLARSIIGRVNRLQASGTGLTEPASITALNAVSSSSAPLSAAGLAFTPGTGSFRVIVHDSSGAVTSIATVAVTAGTTTLDDVVTALNADPDLSASVSGGRLTIATTAGNTLAFADDSSDALMALGINTFFTGSNAGDIALSPLIAGDPNAIAAARADGAGLVHPGDGTNALALSQLRGATTMAGGTMTFTDFFGAMVGRVGSQMSEANNAVDRQQAAVQTIQSLQQQTSAVSTDEETIALNQSQNAYAAAARYIATVQSMAQTLLDMVATSY